MTDASGCLLQESCSHLLFTPAVHTQVAHLLHVDEHTWLAVIAFLGVALELPILMQVPD